MDEKNTTYACPICGFRYADEETAKKCEAACRTGKCDTEIQKLAVDRGSGCEDGVCRRPETVADYEKKLADMNGQVLRALADYQNLQKEVARERSEMGGYAVLRVVERFLPLLDYLKQAQASKPNTDDKTVANWIMGVDHVARMYEEALLDLGLKPIKVTPGEKFDATKHEAVSAVTDSENDFEPGSVLQEMQRGYELNGKVVRPAKVYIVSEHKK